MSALHLLAPERCQGCDDVRAAVALWDGLCPDCHPKVDSTGRTRRTGYLSPDAYERAPEYHDHRAQYNRQRVIDNDRGAL